MVDEISGDIRRMRSGKASVMSVADKLAKLDAETLEVVAMVSRTPISQLRNIIEYGVKQASLDLRKK